MQKKTLALVMCVKNEEVGLERAIKSARPFCDYVLVQIDKSSTDKTAEIAKELADEIKYFKFADDFSEMRNNAAVDIKQDYILWLDGHEYLEKCEHLQEMLELGVDGLNITIKMENGSEFRNPKIYRNGCQFTSRYHEFIVAKNVILYPGCVIIHDRIGGQSIEAVKIRDAQRDEMTPRIMLEDYKKDKKAVVPVLHLAMHWQSKGKFKEAIYWYKKCLKIDTFLGERWWECFNIALCYLALGKNFRAHWYTVKAEWNLPNTWEIKKLKGMCYFNAGKFDKALEWLVASFHTNDFDQPYKPWKPDPTGTWNLIGESFFNLGNYAKAAMAFNRAAKLCEKPEFKSFLCDRVHLMEKMAE